MEPTWLAWFVGVVLLLGVGMLVVGGIIYVVAAQNAMRPPKNDKRG